MRISDWSSDVCSSDLRLGGKVIEVENISKAFGDKLLFENLSFSLPPGGIVGVIGPNGAGKSTLFKLITGQETPDSGKVTIGDTRSEEHTSELPSLMRSSYAVFSLKQKNILTRAKDVKSEDRARDDRKSTHLTAS